MTEAELIEQLADKEHASWARWMDYLFSKCVNSTLNPGDLVIPAHLVEHWRKEVATTYADLPERIKQSDRDEVAHILPIIQEYRATQPMTFTWYPKCSICGLNHAAHIVCSPLPGGGATFNWRL